MRRSDFQRLAVERLEDAKALFRAERFGAAHYIAGYAIECGLKALICRRIAAAEEFPDKDGKRYYTHDLGALLRMAALESEMASTEALRENWSRIKDWDPEMRYQSSLRDVADVFLRAITDEPDGVFSCLTRYW